ncbi:efflux RND transporter periplasmic adaptor subunit [Brevundimonas diminuta]|nr:MULTISPECIES: efflux RND transporter periplasmic adaptor subunit [Brevundimonas]MBD3572601.1 efflux RND transporter periplasmic adaptor subunit [Brevundimonas diminuta]MBI2249975.1 efflux RND transporter periplasmic adaptor subunit [Brevundimonas diminuta]OMG61014.1 efflux transporter periplasmic adaptor subunit [Brevundimonas sp. ZS04]OWR21840.1 efflux RND transporter periplasmic adaptor subunit [Brevundimonas diminuta]QAT16147.1 efflux RND transporter periplasmic adaptor subunit [Brevundi
MAGAAVAVVAIGGGAFLLTRDGPAPSAQVQASAEAGAEEEAAGKVEEGVIALTPAQIEAAGITVMAVGRGGGGEIRLAGRVEPMIDARAVVAASVGGRVERVLVAPGQSVRAGQPLAVLVSGEAATFRADADAAAAAADAARSAYQRNDSLASQGVVARQEVETSRAQSLSADAAARAARARASAAGGPNASGRISVSSPISGVVTSVQVGPGGFAPQGGVIAEVTNPTRVELVFNAPPALAAQVRTGSSLRVQGPTGEFDAVVTGVAVGGAGESGATLIRARPSGGALPPAGSPVSGALVTGGDADGMTVPSEAVQTLEGATVVFVQVQGGFRAVPVMTGRQAGGRTEILRGLTGAERIAGAKAFLLKAELSKSEAEEDE